MHSSHSDFLGRSEMHSMNLALARYYLGWQDDVVCDAVLLTDRVMSTPLRTEFCNDLLGATAHACLIATLQSSPPSPTAAVQYDLLCCKGESPQSSTYGPYGPGLYDSAFCPAGRVCIGKQTSPKDAHRLDLLEMDAELEMSSRWPYLPSCSLRKAAMSLNSTEACMLNPHVPSIPPCQAPKSVVGG